MVVPGSRHKQITVECGSERRPMLGRRWVLHYRIVEDIELVPYFAVAGSKAFADLAVAVADS